MNLTHRQVADRLFNDLPSLPQRVFTGFDVPWGDINNRWHCRNPWRDLSGSVMALPRLEKIKCRMAGLADDKQRALLLEAAVAAIQPLLVLQTNLLDDMLIAGERQAFDSSRTEVKLYWRQPYDEQVRVAETLRVREAGVVFRKWIESASTGWVDIVRFNDRLLFLRGRDGEYDFVFRGMRDEALARNLYAPYLRSHDVPKSNDAHHFERWLYHQYEGWLEADRHRAEAHFYASGGVAASYPGQQEVLSAYLVASGSYHPAAVTQPRADGYRTVKLGETLLNVSDLVTISQFKAFAASDPGYFAHRQKQEDLDAWEPVNLDDANELPVSVTWYDANAYASWISRNQGLPVRLLTEEEYCQLRSHLSGLDIPPLVGGMIPWNAWPELVSDVDDGPMPSRRVRYRPFGLRWHENGDGVRFLCSAWFGEWLNAEGAAANTAYGTALHYGHCGPYAARFATGSTGKYKGMKIGFRLCYFHRDGETLPRTASA